MKRTFIVIWPKTERLPNLGDNSNDLTYAYSQIPRIGATEATNQDAAAQNVLYRGFSAKKLNIRSANIIKSRLNGSGYNLSDVAEVYEVPRGLKEKGMPLEPLDERQHRENQFLANDICNRTGLSFDECYREAEKLLSRFVRNREPVATGTR
jgi:hypothetical protein